MSLTGTQAQALLQAIGPCFDSLCRFISTGDPARIAELQSLVATALTSGAQMTTPTSTVVNGQTCTNYMPSQNWAGVTVS
jgi:hypothetical protein